MDKKSTKKKKEVIYDDSEDLEIKNIAHFKNSQQILLLIILILLFMFTLFCTIFYVDNYYKAKNEIENNNDNEVIQVNSQKNKIVILNEEDVRKKITEEDFNDNNEIVIENINSIQINTSNKEDGKLFFDVIYDIEENDFKYNSISTTNSDILVRFSYSFDKENWEYINNVISTSDSTLNALLGSFYDIGGLKTTLNVVTNHELNNKKGETKTMYWKCETVIKTSPTTVGNKIKAKFKINYKNNV